MTWFLRFTFWFAVGAAASGAGIFVYLLSAVRRVELFPALAGAVVASGVVLLIAVRCIVWAQGRRKRHPAVETILIGEPALETIGTR